MPNLLSLTCPSLQILSKTQTVVFPISNFWLTENCYKSRTSNDIDMKLVQVIKILQLKQGNVKKADDLMFTNCDILPFFQFMTNLEQSGEAGFLTHCPSLKLTFLLIVTFYFTKTGKTKKSLTQLSHYCFE